jgi:SAM-dependent methyltransferase
VSAGKFVLDERLATLQLVELVQQKRLSDEAARRYLLHACIPATVKAFHLIARTLASDPVWGAKLQSGTFRAVDLGAGHNLLNYLLREKLRLKPLATDLVVVDSTNMIQCDFHESLPFPNCAFDLVTSTEVFEHIWNPWLFLTEQFRILRPGGVIYLATPNFARVEARLKLVRSVFFPRWPTSAGAFVSGSPFRQHIREYALDELLEAIHRTCPEAEVIESGYFQSASLRRSDSLGIRLIAYLVRPLKLIPSLNDTMFAIWSKPN